MSASQSGVYNTQQFTDMGAPLVGGRLFTYAFGTTTHKTAFTDHAGAIPHTYSPDGLGGQFIALDARGELPAPLYLTGGSYDLALKTAAGATVWTRRADPVWDITSDLSASSGASLVGYMPSGVGAVATDVAEQLTSIQSSWLNVKDAPFYAMGTGVNDSPAINSAITNGHGAYLIPAGSYTLSGSLIIDYSGVSFPAPGGPSARVSLVGNSMHNTILDYVGPTGTAVIQKTGPVSFTSAGVYANDIIQDIVLNDTGATRTRIGISVTNLAYAEYRRLGINGFASGIYFNSSISTKFDNVAFSANTIGLVLDNTTGQSLPNANSFDNCDWNGNMQAAVVGNKSGATNRFTSCRFEQNGIAGGTGTTGGVFLDIDGSNGTATVVFDSCYFEGNGGLADAYLTNISALPVTVVFKGCVFNRTSSTKYVTNNIVLSSTGGGSIKCVLIGCGFFSAGNYAPSSARKFVSVNENCEIIDIGCTYSETTSKNITFIPAVTSSVSVVAGSGDSVGTYVLPNLPAPAMYIVSSNIGPVGDAVNWGATATIFTDGASARMISNTNTILQQISLTGLTIFGTQTSGLVQTITTTVTRVA